MGFILGMCVGMAMPKKKSKSNNYTYTPIYSNYQYKSNDIDSVKKSDLFTNIFITILSNLITIFSTYYIYNDRIIDIFAKCLFICLINILNVCCITISVISLYKYKKGKHNHVRKQFT
jgi:hypothetical protein